MRRVGIFRASALVDVVNYLGVPLLAIYIVSMLVWPWVSGRGDWSAVQGVWDRWQTLNAGALAFLASLVAFNIARYNESRQRERDFTAAKAFLPSTLSSLMEYCSQCAQVYALLWERNGEPGKPVIAPTLPQGYREVFSNCMRCAEPVVGVYLSAILVRLQVHDARIRESTRDVAAGPERVTDRHSLLAYVLRLGELHALIGNLFGFAREEEAFREKDLTWDDLRGSYGIMNVDVDEFVINDLMNLQAFTRRWLTRTGGKLARSGWG